MTGKMGFWVDLTSRVARVVATMPGHLPPAVRKRLAQALRSVLLIARKGAGLTQEKLAQRIGLGTSTYRRIEKGLMSPGVSTLRRLCRVLCTSLDALLGPECAAAVERAIQPPRRRRPARAGTRRSRSSAQERPPQHPLLPIPSEVYPLLSSQESWSLLTALPRSPVAPTLPLILMRRGAPLALVVDLG
jgi:transcriptional regulator with XRE-family HTH domain